MIQCCVLTKWKGRGQEAGEGRDDLHLEKIQLCLLLECHRFYFYAVYINAETGIYFFTFLRV